MNRLLIAACLLMVVTGCSTSLEESLEKSRLEIVDPTPDGDFSDAYFRDTLTGETCERRRPGRIGC
ncbi:hypothetical protein [Yoonia sp. R2-816]|uniref:hypothetical protein n=1 Tax=Yoonia sp. R2-816 TaxID=3342638 RepID=UPI00372BCD4A